MSNDKYALMKMPVDEIGRALACSTDIEQAQVINSLAYELMNVCRDSDLSGMQVCYMANGLDSNGRKLILSLSDFIHLREETKPSP
jgi:hypothetical protein